MTSDMLSMDSLQSAEMHLNYDLFRLEDFVRDYAEPYLFQAESGGKTLQIRVTPGLSLWADKKLIGQLLGLLLENAVKYTEEGDAIVLAVTGGENEVTISVKDTGIGISEEAMDKVFTATKRRGLLRMEVVWGSILPASSLSGIGAGLRFGATSQRGQSSW